MSELVGYRLLDASDNVVQSWGGVWGQCPGIPNPIRLPNGDDVHAPELGVSYGGYTLAAWEMDPPPVTSEQIGAERERRIAMPLLVVLPGLDPFAINMDEKSQRNIQGLASQGVLLLMTSDPTTIQFLDYANEFQQLGGAQLVAMGQQAAARIQACYQAQWALMDLDPVPTDYADDAYWPPAEPIAP
jgi:hypothetical protein